MRGFLKLTLGLSLLFTTPLLYADDECGGSEDHWGDVSEESSIRGLPIMMVFNSTDCGYCYRLKEEIIQPRLNDGSLRQQVVVRSFNIESNGKVEDFDGSPVRSRVFVSRYQVFATPTVMIVDPAGNRLGSPLVGYDNALDYGERLKHAIDEATQALRLAPPV